MQTFLPCDIYLGFDYNNPKCFFNLPFCINYIKPYSKNKEDHKFSYINYYDQMCSLKPEEDKYNFFYKMNQEKLDKIFQKKDNFCCSLISNDKYNGYRGVPSSHLRTALINIICDKYKNINNGGKHLNNIDKDISYDEENDWILKHKFMIAFENSLYDGYITEKIFKEKKNGCIPIYFGSKIMKGFNKKSFIIINDHDIKLCYNNDNTITNLVNMSIINKIKEIDENDNLYKEMLSEPLLDVEYIEFRYYSLSIYQILL